MNMNLTSYFMKGGTKTPFKLKQTCIFQLPDYVSVYELLIPSSMKDKWIDKEYSICQCYWSINMLRSGKNQEFYRTGKFSWNKDTLINNNLEPEKERPCREKYLVFSPGNSKLLFKWELQPIGDHKWGHFPPN